MLLICAHWGAAGQKLDFLCKGQRWTMWPFLLSNHVPQSSTAPQQQDRTGEVWGWTLDSVWDNTQKTTSHNVSLTTRLRPVGLLSGSSDPDWSAGDPGVGTGDQSAATVQPKRQCDRGQRVQRVSRHLYDHRTLFNRFLRSLQLHIFLSRAQKGRFMRQRSESCLVFFDGYRVSTCSIVSSLCCSPNWTSSIPTWENTQLSKWKKNFSGSKGDTVPVLWWVPGTWSVFSATLSLLRLILSCSLCSWRFSTWPKRKGPVLYLYLYKGTIRTGKHKLCISHVSRCHLCS